MGTLSPVLTGSREPRPPQSSGSVWWGGLGRTKPQARPDGLHARQPLLLEPRDRWLLAERETSTASRGRSPQGSPRHLHGDRSALWPLRGPALLSVSQQPFVAVTWPGLELTDLERKICILRRLFCQTRSETGRLYPSPQG